MGRDRAARDGSVPLVCRLAATPLVLLDEPAGGVNLPMLADLKDRLTAYNAGQGLDRLYVTSAAEPLSAAEREAEPLAGLTLVLDVGVRGRPEYRTPLC